MSRYRMYPEPWQAEVMLGHCGQARHMWNLGLDQWCWYLKGGPRGSAPGYGEQARQLTELRAGCGAGCGGEDCACGYGWVGTGNADVQQQALKDLHQALSNFFAGTHGFPTWRRKYEHEGFRVIGTGRIPVFEPDGSPRLNAKGKQVIERRVRVEKLNRRWARVKVPGCGWVRFRLTRKGLPVAKSFRVTWRHGQWHVAFSVGAAPDPVPAPGTGTTLGVDRGVTITAALSDGQLLNCPQLTSRQRARLRKHLRRAARAKKGSPERAAEYAKAARIRLVEVNRRKDWCEKTSTMLARTADELRFEKLNIKNMTATARGTADQPGKNVRQKAGLNRLILAQGWGLLRQRTGHKAPGRVFDVPAPHTSLRCSTCGWIDKNSRKSQAVFVCSSCGFTCNADTNASVNLDQADQWQTSTTSKSRGRTGRIRVSRTLRKTPAGCVPEGQHPLPPGSGSSVREPQLSPSS